MANDVIIRSIDAMYIKIQAFGVVAAFYERDSHHGLLVQLGRPLRGRLFDFVDALIVKRFETWISSERSGLQRCALQGRNVAMPFDHGVLSLHQRQSN